MEGCGVVEGQATGSGVGHINGETAGGGGKSGFDYTAADNFQHTQNPHSHA